MLACMPAVENKEDGIRYTGMMQAKSWLQKAIRYCQRQDVKSAEHVVSAMMVLMDKVGWSLIHNTLVTCLFEDCGIHDPTALKAVVCRCNT